VQGLVCHPRHRDHHRLCPRGSRARRRCCTSGRPRRWRRWRHRARVPFSRAPADNPDWVSILFCLSCYFPSPPPPLPSPLPSPGHTRLYAYPSHDGPVLSAAFQGRLLTTASADASFRVWDPALVTPLPAHPAPIVSAALSPNGLYSVTCDRNGIAILVAEQDRENANARIAFSPHGVSSLFLPSPSSLPSHSFLSLVSILPPPSHPPPSHPPPTPLRPPPLVSILPPPAHRLPLTCRDPLPAPSFSTMRRSSPPHCTAMSASGPSYVPPSLCPSPFIPLSSSTPPPRPITPPSPA
jgi:WD40 repeat protein